MIADPSTPLRVVLKPYPAMKDSGVPWLGVVPKHWEARRLKQAFRRIVGGSTPSSAEATYWDGDVVWVTPADISKTDRISGSQRRITREGLNSCSTELVPPRSVLVTSRAPVGNVAIAEVELCTNQGCKALIVTDEGVNPMFGFHVLKTLKSELQSLATGTTFTEISTSRLGTIAMPLPPLPEQAAIVRFVEHADRRIKRYIRAKQKLIKLLEEQKQAIIHRAVTRGLDPKVRLRPSGVEWLADVPKHWDVAALRHRYSQVLGKMLDAKRITGSHSLPYLRNTDVQWDWINVDDLPTMDIPAAEYGRYTVQKGDLLVCEGGEVGRCAIWWDELGICGFQKALHRLRPVNAARDVPRFMYYALRAAAKGNAFNDGHVSTIAHLTGDKLRAHGFPFPPIAEQESIVGFLDSALKQVDQATAGAHREVSLLREYRTRLIADVVTGKIDVREAAAKLPDETDESESLDDADLDAIPEEAEA